MDPFIDALVNGPCQACGLSLKTQRDLSESLASKAGDVSRLEARVAELESDRRWLLQEIAWAAEGKTSPASLASVLRVAGATPSGSTGDQ